VLLHHENILFHLFLSLLFHLSFLANEKIEDINGYPKSRTQMVGVGAVFTLSHKGINPPHPKTEIPWRLALLTTL
jgi:hypothetical protein